MKIMTNADHIKCWQNPPISVLVPALDVFQQNVRKRRLQRFQLFPGCVAFFIHVLNVFVMVIIIVEIHIWFSIH